VFESVGESPTSYENPGRVPCLDEENGVAASKKLDDATLAIELGHSSSRADHG